MSPSDNGLGWNWIGMHFFRLNPSQGNKKTRCSLPFGYIRYETRMESSLLQQIPIHFPGFDLINKFDMD